MNYPRVSIVIVNWNGLEDTIECLESLKKITYPNYEVIVVDNGSEGNDAKVLEERFGDYIHLIKNDKNYGFGGGANIGIRYALNNSNPNYLTLLNNDTVVDPGVLTEMVSVAEADPTISIAWANLYCYDEPDQLQSVVEMPLWTGVALPLRFMKTKILRIREIDRGQYDSVKEVGMLALVCCLIRASVIENIGLVDERYFGSFEESDYFFRAREAGCKTVCIPKAKVWHKYRSEKRIDEFLQYYRSRGLFRLVKQHAAGWQYRLFLIYFLGVHFWLATAYYLVWCRRPRVLLSYYKGVRDGLFNFRKKS